MLLGIAHTSSCLDGQSVFSQVRDATGRRLPRNVSLPCQRGVVPVLLNRRFLTCCATVLALLIGSSSAFAKTHAAHNTRISGVVVSINAKRHTLKLRIRHGHPRVANTATAGPRHGHPRVATVASADG